MDLKDEIERIAGECGGTVAVAAAHVTTGRQLEREARRPFPSASVIKVPILAALHAEAAAGRLAWEETVSLTEAIKVPGSGVLRELHAGIELNLEDLARLMIVVSDNTATNLLIDRLGTRQAQVGPQARPGGHPAPAHHIGLDQRPRAVADDSDGLTGVEERLGKLDQIGRSSRSLAHQFPLRGLRRRAAGRDEA